MRDRGRECERDWEGDSGRAIIEKVGMRQIAGVLNCSP